MTISSKRRRGRSGTVTLTPPHSYRSLMSDTDPAAEPIDEPTNETPDAEARDTDTDAASPESPESREPVTGEDLIDAVAQRRDTINYRASSYDQGRHEELTWVLDLIDPEVNRQPTAQTNTVEEPDEFED